MGMTVGAIVAGQRPELRIESAPPAISGRGQLASGRLISRIAEGS